MSPEKRIAPSHTLGSQMENPKHFEPIELAQRRSRRVTEVCALHPRVIHVPAYPDRNRKIEHALRIIEGLIIEAESR